MDSTKSDNGMKKQYKLVPPDGGWAYMVWIAAIINFSVLTMFLPSIGMIFNSFYIELGMGSTDIQVQNGVNSMSVAVGGFLSGPLMKVVSLRKLSFFGATSATLGIFGVVFVNSYPMFLLCQGILMGTGTGVLYNVACTALNDYFLEKRFMMTSLAQAISAIAAIVAPLAIHWTAENYGYRATIILMAGVYLQTLVGSALQQPVKWHLKKVPINPETEKFIKEKNNFDKDNNIETIHVTEISIDQIATAKTDSVLGYIKDAFDWTFLKQFLRTCTCVGAPLGLVSDVMFTLFVPQALYARGWEEGEVAWALALLSFGDIATRIFLIVASVWLKKIGNNIIFIFGMLTDVAVKFVFLWFPHPTVAYVTLTLTGCSRCLLIVLFSLVISDAVPPEKYGVAFGVAVLVYGTFGITLGPAIGAVRDVTGTYESMFYLLIGIMGVVTVAWCVEVYHEKNSAKKSSSTITTTKGYSLNVDTYIINKINFNVDSHFIVLDHVFAFG
ncbi:monocarboxylate transporter 13-like [Leguminivora glycinivorella]|uniref:monocarboxylate transporter 13-like n=1 Tax=Leguminivora glycinivorella TaxID=1035111 RepID=UPI00200E2957|nr:monocarboxylate transporter 13-like [Leguminivora glycinivorella]